MSGNTELRSHPHERHDTARFLRNWSERPLTTGAIAPSGRALARLMAGYVDPRMTGPVIEIGPGTGPVTRALLARGIARDRLVLVEYAAEFCALLRERFPGVSVIQGDAYALGRTLAPHRLEPAVATLSSLPLLTRSPAERVELLRECLSMMRPGAPFVQFTYASASPIPLPIEGVLAAGSRRIWRNLPPARVWVYRRRAA